MYICHYISHAQTSIIMYPISPHVTVTDSNQIGKNRIPEAELIAGSAAGK